MNRIFQKVGVLAALALIVAPTATAYGGSSTSSITPTAAELTGAASKAKGTGAGTPAPKPLPTLTNVTLTMPVKLEAFAAPWVAQQMGEFKKENLNVTIENDPGGSAAEPQELSQGTSQAIETGINAGTLNAINEGVGISYVGQPYVYSHSDKEGFYVNKTYLNPNGTLKKSMVSTFKISLGTAGLAAPAVLDVQAWLSKSGVSLSQLSVINLQGPDQTTALQNGSIEAAYALAPYYVPLVSDSRFKLVTKTPLTATGDIEMSTKFIQQKPAVAQAIMRALIRTDRTELAPGYRNNTAVMNVLTSWLGVPAATIEANPPVVFSTDMNTTSLGPIVGSLQRVWLNLKQLAYKTPVALDKLVDLSVVDNALASSNKAKK